MAQRVHCKYLNLKMRIEAGAPPWMVPGWPHLREQSNFSNPKPAGTLSDCFSGWFHRGPSPNPCCAIRKISRPIGSDAVAAGDTTFHTCSMFCEHTN